MLEKIENSSFVFRTRVPTLKSMDDEKKNARQEVRTDPLILAQETVGIERNWTRGDLAYSNFPLYTYPMTVRDEEEVFVVIS